MPRWTPFEPYFWSLVNKTETCWLWTGDKSKGYGRVNRGKIRTGSHRVSYEMAYGEIPKGLLVCHHCDVRACVRPDHLFVGTCKDNMQDWTKKGKNRLANDRSLWGNGRHWKDADKRRRQSETLKQQFASGKRVMLQDANGRLLGSKMVW